MVMWLLQHVFVCLGSAQSTGDDADDEPAPVLAVAANLTVGFTVDGDASRLPI